MLVHGLVTALSVLEKCRFMTQRALDDAKHWRKANKAIITVCPLSTPSQECLCLVILFHVLAFHHGFLSLDLNTIVLDFHNSK